MRRKNKGRKIYKTKEKNYYGKTPLGKALSVGLTVLLIGGIGFIGYSVAEPVFKYTKKKGDAPEPPPTAASSELLEPTSSAPKIQPGDPSAETGTVAQPDYKAAVIKTSDLTDKAALKAAIERIPSGQKVEYVEIPLKTQGGKIWYTSSVYYATQSGAIQNYINLSDIIDTVKAAGYHPAALISTFNDNILPKTDGSAGFKTADAGDQWIDNTPEAGGKPWTSPYSSTAVNYIGDIVTEAAEAGFEKIICSDISYPPFRPSDLALLPPELKEPSRFQALTSAANLFYDRAVRANSTMAVEVSATDILKDNADVIREPLYLNVKSIILSIDVDALSAGVYTDSTVYDFNGTAAEKVEKVLGLVKDKLKDYTNVAVRISGSTVGTDELLKAKEVAYEQGYTSFVIG